MHLCFYQYEFPCLRTNILDELLVGEREKEREREREREEERNRESWRESHNGEVQSQNGES